MTAKAYIHSDPSLGSVIILRSEEGDHSIEATIAPDYGSNLVSYKIDGHEVINCDVDGLLRRNSEGTSAYTATPILFPAPNRVMNEGRAGEYVFDDVTHTFKGVLSPSGNASLVHGLVRDALFEFAIVKGEGDTAFAETSIEIMPMSRYFMAYPYPCRLVLTWTMSGSGLCLEWKVENTGPTRLGFGFAMHPEFITGGNDVRVCVPARSVMEMDEELVSTGRKLDLSQVMYKMLSLATEKPVSVLDLDHVYTDKVEGAHPYVRYENLGFSIALESDCDSVVVYTGKRKVSACVEPQWGKTNALNLFAQGYPEAIHGLKLLEPDNSTSGTVLFKVTRD